MRFYDEVIKDPKTSQATKDLLKDCVVIDASNVSEYYYQGTDKEHWSLEDFPNIAPPFGRFWLDFDSPKYCVSSETGTREWGSDMPSRWGVHCQAIAMSEYAERIKTEEGRRQIKQSLVEFFLDLKLGMERQCPNIYAIARRGEEYSRAHLSADHFTLLSRVMALDEQLEKIEVGDWEGFANQQSPYKWQMDVTIFDKMFVHGKDTIMGPLWSWRLYIASNGVVAYDPTTNVPLTFSSPRGFMVESIKHLQESGMTYHDAWYQLSQSVNPLFHTGMLSISFMHCKNILMTDVRPEKKVVRNKSAKRRNAQDYQPVTYKTLDIYPMKQVLQQVESSMGPGERDRTSRSFHICRGHFADYTEGRGLFGRYHGTFWIPQHTRGSVPRMDIKDYRINL